MARLHDFTLTVSIDDCQGSLMRHVPSFSTSALEFHSSIGASPSTGTNWMLATQAVNGVINSEDHLGSSCSR